MIEQEKPGLGAMANGAAKNTGPSLSDAMKSAAASLEAGLLKPGRYTLTVTDVRAGERTGPIGWGVINAAAEGVGEHAELSVFVPIELGPNALVQDENGAWILNPEKFEPRQARFAIAGMNRLAALVSAAGLDAGTIEGPDDLALLLGARFEAMISKGKDRDGLPKNQIAKIIGAAPAPSADEPAPEDTADDPYLREDPTDPPF